MAFKVGDKIVYPNHGVGVIETIQESLAEGSTNPCYQVRLIGNNSRVMVPVGNSDRIGLRPLTRRQEVGGVFRVLEDVVVIVGSSDWKGRYKQNLDKMRSGRLTDIADVLKNLSWVQKQKALSFREKKMYERARYLIVSEIAQVNGLSEPEVEREVEKALERSMARKRPSGPKDH
ncbi:MAG: CarD family transcriptional regulator [Acidobacteria bacterium]|nr:CarD family transcriptional regulator [Acidobacteriota bacterium]